MKDLYDGFLAAAEDKLTAGRGAKLSDKHANAMKESVADALLEFCRQDGEFAQAVAQGGDFAACMAAVAKEVKNGALSDVKAWGTAVKFYFPGADIAVTMRINLCAGVEDGGTEAEAPEGAAVIDLSAFF